MLKLFVGVQEYPTHFHDATSQALSGDDLARVAVLTAMAVV